MEHREHLSSTVSETAGAGRAVLVRLFVQLLPWAWLFGIYFMYALTGTISLVFGLHFRVQKVKSVLSVGLHTYGFTFLLHRSFQDF
jgi:hypothetical protein